MTAKRNYIHEQVLFELKSDEINKDVWEQIKSIVHEDLDEMNELYTWKTTITDTIGYTEDYDIISITEAISPFEIWMAYAEDKDRNGRIIIDLDVYRFIEEVIDGLLAPAMSDEDRNYLKIITRAFEE